MRLWLLIKPKPAPDIAAGALYHEPRICSHVDDRSHFFLSLYIYIVYIILTLPCRTLCLYIIYMDLYSLKYQYGLESIHVYNFAVFHCLQVTETEVLHGL